MMHQSLSKPLYGQIGVPNNLTGKGTGFPLDLENLENLEKWEYTWKTWKNLVATKNSPLTPFKQYKIH